MRNIFMSYASGDKPLVKPLADLLRNTGVLEPWFDSYLVAGLDWKRQIAFAISKCDIFLYAITPESVHSSWCAWELEQAIKLGKPIMPVMMSATHDFPRTLAQPLTSIQRVDLTNGYTPDAVSKLIAGLLYPSIEQLALKAQPVPVEPIGPPPQAPDEPAQWAEVSGDKPPGASGTYTDVTPAYDVFWKEYRDRLADQLAYRLLDIQNNGCQIRFDKFVIYIDRHGHRSDWTYYGVVEPTPYEEFVHDPSTPVGRPQRISEAELRIWIQQFRQSAYDEVAKPIVKNMRQKLVDQGWNPITMTKRWAVTRNLALLKVIGYELIDTQREVFHICLGEVAMWPRN